MSARYSDAPTAYPTTEDVMSSCGLYDQSFIRTEDFFSNQDDYPRLTNLFENYTIFLIPEDAQSKGHLVNTTCDIDEQNSIKNSVDVVDTRLSYRCSYTSRVVDVTAFDEAFKEYINGNLTKITEDIRSLGIQLNELEEVKFRIDFTQSPTLSSVPSIEHSPNPSKSSDPSSLPSLYPSLQPSKSSQPSIGIALCLTLVMTSWMKYLLQDSS